MITTSYTLPPHRFGTPWSLAVRENLPNKLLPAEVYVQTNTPARRRRIGRGIAPGPPSRSSSARESAGCRSRSAGGDILTGMQTRYLLVASLITGLVILVAAAVWMATRL